MKINIELDDHDVGEFLERIEQLDRLLDDIAELRDLIAQARELVDER